MAILPIISYPDPILRRRCKPVTGVTSEIRKLLDDMADTMYHAPGIGLAAAQVGSPHRAIVMDVGGEKEGDSGKLYKIVNPVITAKEGQTETEEGCLSIPEVRATVERAAKICLVGLDEKGAEFTLEAQGLLAVCIQHEIDHLDGILFIDRISRLKRELIKSQLKQLEKSLGSKKK